MAAIDHGDRRVQANTSLPQNPELNLVDLSRTSRLEPIPALNPNSQIGRCDSSAPLERGQTVDQAVSVNGETRPYSVHLPANWDGKTPLPVLYYFNGRRPNGNPEPESFTGLSQESDRLGFAVVYMRGDANNNQTYDNGQSLFRNGRDENAYLNAVHDRLGRQLPLDSRRQGLAGFSEGGSEAYSLSARNTWVSSAQSVEGYTTGYEAPLNHPVSQQNIHALRDRIVPYNGTAQLQGQADREAQRMLDSTQAGAEPYLDIPFLFHAGLAAFQANGNNVNSQSDIINTYNRANGITGAAEVAMQNGNTIRTWRGENGTMDRQVTLETGGHGWAGSHDHSGDVPIIGVPNDNFDATHAIGQFLLITPLVELSGAPLK